MTVRQPCKVGHDEKNLPWQLPLRRSALRGRDRPGGAQPALQLFLLPENPLLGQPGAAHGFPPAGRERHYFCRHCGVRPFGRGDSPRSGPFVGIGVNCLDDAAVAELAQVPITFVDGWHDAWETPPQETRHL